MAHSYIVKTLGWDRSIDLAALSRFEPHLKTYFPPSAFPEKWYLATLSVHPSYQRRGIGKKLMQWGVQQAENERVPICLEATASGRGLYEQFGIQVVRVVKVDGMTFPIMVWDPPGLSEEESWVEWMKRQDDEEKKTA